MKNFSLQATAVHRCVGALKLRFALIYQLEIFSNAIEYSFLVWRKALKKKRKTSRKKTKNWLRLLKALKLNLHLAKHQPVQKVLEQRLKHSSQKVLLRLKNWKINLRNWKRRMKPLKPNANPLKRLCPSTKIKPERSLGNPKRKSLIQLKRKLSWQKN